jgi:hypothetical protein
MFNVDPSLGPLVVPSLPIGPSFLWANQGGRLTFPAADDDAVE